MKLEDQVTSLTLSRKLKELGVPISSYYVWIVDNEKTTRVPAWLAGGDAFESVNDNYGEIKLVVNGSMKAEKVDEVYPAFTVAELGEMFELNKTEWLICSKDPVNKQFVVEYRKGFVKADTEANARAKILIYLIENNLVDIKTLAPPGVDG